MRRFSESAGSHSVSPSCSRCLCTRRDGIGWHRVHGPDRRPGQMRRSRGSPRERERLLKAGRPREALEAISAARAIGRDRANSTWCRAWPWSPWGSPSRRGRHCCNRSRSVPISPWPPRSWRPSRSVEARSSGAWTTSPGQRRSIRAIFRPLYAAGEVHFRMGRMDAAIRAFEAALLRKADHQESRIGLLAASLAIRPPEQSSALVRGLLRDFPRNPQCPGAGGQACRALGDAGSSLRYVERAIELDPDFVDAIVTRAHLLYMTGKVKSALAEATRAAELRPQEPAGTRDPGAAPGRPGTGGAVAGDAGAAAREVVSQSEQIRELTDQIAQHPDDPVPRWQFGQVEAATGARGLAIESYRAALALDRQCQPALAGLRSLLEAPSPSSPSPTLPAPPTAGR